MVVMATTWSGSVACRTPKKNPSSDAAANVTAALHG
jgi:hypothetical protein